MVRLTYAVLVALSLAVHGAAAGDAENAAAQSSIEAQLKAFLAGDDAAAYTYAAPNVTRLFPTLEAFMSMVTRGYAPVHQPKSYACGPTEERGNGLAQQVFVVGPDGKDYEAVYTLELQPDGVWRITGVSLRASQSIGT